jgi:hypothetical protein
MGVALEFAHDKDEIYPILLCDQCGGLIDDSKEAHVLYLPPPLEARQTAQAPMRVTSVAFVHKPCGRIYEADRPDERFFWLPLEHFMMQQAYHLGWPALAKKMSTHFKQVRDTAAKR